MTNKTLKKHIATLRNNWLTEREILSVKNALNRESRVGNAVTRMLLLEAMRYSYGITREQSDKGLAWIRSKCFKANGEFRRSKSVPFGEFELTKIKLILDDFSHWTFDGFTDCSTGWFPRYVPIYTMHSRTGESFGYAVTGQGVVVS